MTLAWIFTIVGLVGLSLAVFDKKATLLMRVFFGFAGFVYAFVGIWMIVKL